MILVIDNYDSFVYNLARYCRELGEETRVVRNDAVTVAQVEEMAPAAIILSPGPGRPQEAGVCLEIIRAFPEVPILGVCLGHQCLAEAYGGKTVPSREPMHGRPSAVSHDGKGVFAGLASPLQVGRYHSLSVDVDGCDDLKITAYTDDQEIMALQHNVHPHIGVQFHPESLLTPQGKTLLANFLKLMQEDAA
jgi:anthranilate synthase component 2/para-aminobenzoate synthetase component 2